MYTLQVLHFSISWMNIFSVAHFCGGKMILWETWVAAHGHVKLLHGSAFCLQGMGGFLYVCKVLKFRSSISNTRRECKELAILVTNCLPLHSDFQKLLPEAAAKDLAQWLWWSFLCHHHSLSENCNPVCCCFVLNPKLHQSSYQAESQKLSC